MTTPTQTTTTTEFSDAADAFDNDVDAWDDTDGDGKADDFPNLHSETVGYQEGT